MSHEVDVGAFSASVADILGRKEARLTAAMQRDVREVGESCARDVRARAASAFGDGPYAQGWEADFSPGESATSIVHNAGRDRTLGHLLELGHEQFWMGHDLGYRYPGVRHVAPAYQDAKADLRRRMR